MAHSLHADPADGRGGEEIRSGHTGRGLPPGLGGRRGGSANGSRPGSSARSIGSRTGRTDPAGRKGSTGPRGSSPVPEGLDWDLWLGPAAAATIPHVSTSRSSGAAGPISAAAPSATWGAIASTRSTAALDADGPRRRAGDRLGPSPGDLPDVLDGPPGIPASGRETGGGGHLVRRRIEAAQAPGDRWGRAAPLGGHRSSSVATGCSSATSTAGTRRCYPKSRRGSFVETPEDRSPDRRATARMARRDPRSKVRTGANFEFSRAVTEALHLGNIALQDRRACHLGFGRHGPRRDIGGPRPWCGRIAGRAGKLMICGAWPKAGLLVFLTASRQTRERGFRDEDRTLQHHLPGPLVSRRGAHPPADDLPGQGIRLRRHRDRRQAAARQSARLAGGAVPRPASRAEGEGHRDLRRRRQQRLQQPRARSPRGPDLLHARADPHDGRLRRARPCACSWPGGA